MLMQALGIKLNVSPATPRTICKANVMNILVVVSGFWNYFTNILDKCKVEVFTRVCG